MESSGDQKSLDTQKNKYQLLLNAEKVGLCLLIAIVWGLLAVPVIIYHVPVPVNVTSTTSFSQNQTCNVEVTNSVCLDMLVGILQSMNCDIDYERGVLVQQNQESTANLLVTGLELIKPSPECQRVALPFFCLYLFGLCDNSSGVSIYPTTGQCEEIRDVICPTEWATALSFDFNLPDCKIFPMESPSCPVLNGSGSGSPSNVSEDVMTPQNDTTKLLECREDFYREESSRACFPSCYSWKESSRESTFARDAILLISAIIGVISALAVMIISVIRFKKMLVFPAVFIVYSMVDLSVVEFFIIIKYFDPITLTCTSKNLLKSFIEVTPYCVISGMVYSYMFLQITLWWLFHTATVFWQIRFPFHAQKLKTERKIKYIHITFILAGLLLPLLPIITSMADFAVDLKSDEFLKNRNVTFVSGGMGYGFPGFPPIICIGTDSDSLFYSLVLPLIILLGIGITIITLLFWFVHKQYGLLIAKKSKGVFKIGTAERKLLIILCYYIPLAVIDTIAFTIAARNAELFAARLTNYFSCEQSGHDPNNPCDRKSFSEISHPDLAVTALVLLGIFPVVNLVYAINIKELKEKFSSCLGKKKIASRSTKRTFLFLSSVSIKLDTK